MGPLDHLFQKLRGAGSAEHTALSFGCPSPWSLRPEAAANTPIFFCAASLLLMSLLSGTRRTEEGPHLHACFCSWTPPQLPIICHAPGLCWGLREGLSECNCCSTRKGRNLQTMNTVWSGAKSKKEKLNQGKGAKRGSFSHGSQGGPDERLVRNGCPCVW